MASFWFTKTFENYFTQTSPVVDLDTDTIKCGLWQSSATPVKTNDYVGDVASELSVSGYTGGYNGAGRHSLASGAVSEQNSGAWAVYDANDPSTWTALTAGQTIGWALIFKEITNDAGSPLICCLDISPDVPTNGGDFTISFAAAASGGIAYVAC